MSEPTTNPLAAFGRFGPSCGKPDPEASGPPIEAVKMRCSLRAGHKGRHFSGRAKDPQWFWDDGRRCKSLPWHFRALANFACHEAAS